PTLDPAALFFKGLNPLRCLAGSKSGGLGTIVSLDNGKNQPYHANAGQVFKYLSNLAFDSCNLCRLHT
ncbi:hypothetical protein, partial [Paenibacillus polysaccharolyticus]|uniref:hypothetical protein n=1 Tax=Paenibacillus polysaccharolyticus TaxID=582692 RepID=UPI001ABFB33E